MAVDTQTLTIFFTILAALVIVNYFFLENSGLSSTDAKHAVTREMIDTIQQIAPTLEVAQIKYDLEKTGDVQKTLDRFLSRGDLPFPPGYSRSNDTPASVVSTTTIKTTVTTSTFKSVDDNLNDGDDDQDGPFGGLSFEQKKREMILVARDRISEKEGIKFV